MLYYTFIILPNHIQYSIPSAIHNLSLSCLQINIQIFWYSILGSVTNMFGDMMSFVTKSLKFQLRPFGVQVQVCL